MIPKTILLGCQSNWVCFVMCSVCIIERWISTQRRSHITHMIFNTIQTSSCYCCQMTLLETWLALYAKNFSRSILSHDSVPVKPFSRLSVSSVLFEQRFSRFVSLWAGFDLHVLRLFFSASLQSDFLCAIIVFISVWEGPLRNIWIVSDISGL